VARAARRSIAGWRLAAGVRRSTCGHALGHSRGVSADHLVQLVREGRRMYVDHECRVGPHAILMAKYDDQDRSKSVNGTASMLKAAQHCVQPTVHHFAPHVAEPDRSEDPANGPYLEQRHGARWQELSSD
jgi:hypothetical protein